MVQKGKKGVFLYVHDLMFLEGKRETIDFFLLISNFFTVKFSGRE